MPFAFIGAFGSGPEAAKRDSFLLTAPCRALSALNRLVGTIDPHKALFFFWEECERWKMEGLFFRALNASNVVLT